MFAADISVKMALSGTAFDIGSAIIAASTAKEIAIIPFITKEALDIYTGDTTDDRN